MLKRWASLLLLLTMVLSFSTVFADTQQAFVDDEGGTATTNSRYILQD